MAKEENIILETNKVTAGYGGVDVLFDASIRVKKGEIAAIIGPNGAGKTTLLRTISGVLSPRKGEIIFKGERLNGKTPRERLELGIGYIPQEDKIFPKMSCIDNLRMGAYTLPKEKFSEMLERVYQLFPILKERRNQIAGQFSGGQRQMLAIARALMVEPDLLLLDEPTSGLQPSLVKEVLDKVKELHKQGITVLIVAQNREALEIAERGYLIRAGQVVLEDTVEGLLKNDQVMQLYFGG
ncbi:ABC transporter ATP-binding protein [Candidatus Aerophobetes bacterium]|uniref:ABC transporter ATP-binding protein n=1 Tax=Aerophobetes bacterium TaxID=2030807 RepID=A0A662DGJ7_UNCAE|nr:MAG: ABC transporter ATP-binding protein [Candidatus Aerophobetes bacterium]